ncbi:prepilin-type N-terminal cleavage/methylation domain-containing protein [PVC group bacterium]|nr:prepilin-type N-terminal cleavage/methylation domain-containing protein [PVC group bacterium]
MKRQQYLKKQKGFTLIELLVVLGVIIILSGLIMAGVMAVRERSQLMKTKVAVKSIERALIQYFYEYGEWPDPAAMVDYSPNYPPETGETGLQVLSPGMRILGGEDIGGANSRHILFLTPPGSSTNTGYLDPWGNPYKFMCDYDDNGTVHIEFSNNNGNTDLVGKGVAVWSRGPDKSDEEPDQKDDIRSW